jgi:hypothetical protein
MIIMPAMLVGGHLLITVVDRVPEVNFERLCREATTGDFGSNDKYSVCFDDERDARDQLVKQWSGFDANDRERCVRMATTGHTSSYIELLTCLEMEQIARKLRKTNNTAALTDEPAQAPARERQKTVAPAPRERLVRQRAPAPPVSLAPPAPAEAQSGPASGLLQAICGTGLKSVLPACR